MVNVTQNSKEDANLTVQRREKGKIEECKAQALCFNGEKQLTLGWRPSAAQ